MGDYNWNLYGDYNWLYLRGDLNWLDGMISPQSSDNGSVRIDLFLRPQDAVTAVVPLKNKKRDLVFPVYILA